MWKNSDNHAWFSQWYGEEIDFVTCTKYIKLKKDCRQIFEKIKLT